MVVARQHDVDPVFVHKRMQHIPQGEDADLRGMRRRAVDGVVEHDDLPYGVLPRFGNRPLHKRVVVGRAAVVGIEHHVQGIAIGKPVIMSRNGAPVPAFVWDVEMLAEYPVVVMVADGRHKRAWNADPWGRKRVRTASRCRWPAHGRPWKA